MNDADKLREIAEFVDDEMFNSHDGDSLRRIASMLDAALRDGTWVAVPKEPTVNAPEGIKMNDELAERVARAIHDAAYSIRRGGPDRAVVVADLSKMARAAIAECERGRVEKIAKLETGLTVVEALKLILPMAKGFAREHRVGSNAEYVLAAEEALTALEKP